MEQPFEHGIKNPLTEQSMAEALGYTKAMLHFYQYLNEVTGRDPEKRFVDSVAILEKISATNGQLTAIFEKEQQILDEMAVNILSGAKNE